MPAPGCGSAWLERLVWDQEVAGSNPVTPIFIIQYDMREWLSGGVSPCQGEGRGFESRLVLLSGCGSAWLERLIWDQEAAGSNPVTPISAGVVQW